MSKLNAITLCIAFIATATAGLTPAPSQDVGTGRGGNQRAKNAAAQKTRTPPPFTQTADYIVEPPDLINVEVQDALPGRPVSGRRLVRPDGKISLGFYGEVFVAGLTVPEIKVKVIDHLRLFIRDEVLGLVALDDAGQPLLDPATGKPKRIDAKESNQVSVELAQCNSKFYYVEGEVLTPGRFPVTGTESVMDAIRKAGGPSAFADTERVVLYSEGSLGSPASFTVDLDQLRNGKFPSTNYQMKPGDRLVVHRLGENRHDDGTTGPNPSQFRAPATLHRLEMRMDEMERKLDVILEAIKRPAG